MEPSEEFTIVNDITRQAGCLSVDSVCSVVPLRERKATSVR
jgi:hypothetical protein